MAVIQDVQDAVASISRVALITTFAATSLILYLVVLGVYRLYISPLAKFPGPKLAALTNWVEVYYEIFKGNGGQFCFEYAKWHQKYGPIIRINNSELHIQDSDFYETLYSSSKAADKLKSLEHRFNNPLSSFATSMHSIHRQRRGALNPFFSRRKIVEHTPIIQARMDRLCERLASEYAAKGKVLVMNEMWGAWTSDIIVGYCFERDYNFVEQPDFRASFTSAMIDLLEPVHFVTQFPKIISFMNALPDSIIKFLQPGMASVLQFNEEMRDQIAGILQNSKVANKEKKSDTMFSAILESNLPPEEVSLTRLQHEAISVVGAGIETTMRALSLASFHILANPPVLQRLLEELVHAIPDSTKVPSYDHLSQLPYLSACIDEALRLSYGTSQRFPRTLHSGPIVYKGWTIPPGVTVSMDNYAVSHDEYVFPNSFSYSPERWLNSPKAPNGKQLSRYMVAFGRGTRSCVGMQLAYAELFIGLATLFRRFSFELYQTDRSAVDLHMDRFVPRPKPGTQGVRVLVQ
ncbi:hypothetical protein MMC18_004553 [Xylographa bjoerkii]|nr:hypothetical protein [Xylographa bjoerkii]